mgnify:FL=1
MDDDLSITHLSPTDSSSLTRRRLLQAGASTTAVSLTGFAGCLNNSESLSPEESDPEESDPQDSDEYAPEEFTQCSRLIIGLGTLPVHGREEIETARDEGVYEADELYITHLMDVEQSYLVQHEQREDPESEPIETFYRVHVTEVNDRYRVELEEVTPSHGVHPIELENRTDTEQTVTTRLERESPDLDRNELETIFEGTITMSPDEKTPVKTFDRYFGEHRITIETDELADTYEWVTVEPKLPLQRVSFNDEEIMPAPRARTEPIYCQDVWEEVNER